MGKFYFTIGGAVALCCFAGVAQAGDVSTEEELKSAIEKGEDVTLTSDIELEKKVLIKSGGFTIAGDSHTLSGLEVAGFGIDYDNDSDDSVNFENLSLTNFVGALINSEKIGHISGSAFENNAGVYGGAIYNSGLIGEISDSVFSNNTVTVTDSGNAYGGAIANVGGETLTLINTSFYNNTVYVMTSGEGEYSAGGAIYSNGNVDIIARGQDVVFLGNQIATSVVEDNEEEDDDDDESEGLIENGVDDTDTDTEEETTFEYASNAITMNGGTLNLITEDDGTITFNDAISSVESDFNLNISGTGTVVFNNDVSGVDKFVFDSSFLQLGLNGNLTVKNYTAKGEPTLTVTVDPDALSASLITVNGDVIGTTYVIVQAISETVISSDQSILFVSADNDETSTAADFVVYRVYGSPYMWKITYQAPLTDSEGTDDEEDSSSDEDEVGSIDGDEDDSSGEEGDSDSSSGETAGWYLSMTDESNPDFRPMAPEIASFLALHSAAAEQNRGVVTSIRNSVSANKFMLKRYNVLYEDHYKTKAVSNLWANPVYRYVKVSAPQEWDASISGFDAGLDLQSDASNKIGVFGSYRYGTYDIGENGYFKANMGSEIEISSYLLGLYYRYDYNNFWTFATVYAGIQHAEIETDDGIRADADGTQYGAGIEMGYAFISGYNWTLEPSLGIFYTSIDYDDMEDKYSKSAEYSTLHQIEGEFGIKLEKTYEHVYGYSKVYVKPSIVQTINFGNEVTITHLGKVDTLDDQTLGRIEVGGRYAVGGKMSLYGYVNYTTGSDYDDIAVGLGFSYRWY